MGGGERDLTAIVEHLTIARRDKLYVYVCLSSDLILDAAATIEEDEGTTYVVERATAESLGRRCHQTTPHPTLALSAARQGCARHRPAFRSAGQPLAC